MSGISSRVKEIVAGHAGKDATLLVDEARFGEDLELDSLCRVEIAVLLEKEFDLSIGDQDVDRIVTIGDAVAFIEAQLAKRGLTATAGDDLRPAHAV